MLRYGMRSDCYLARGQLNWQQDWWLSEDGDQCHLPVLVGLIPHTEI